MGLRVQAAALGTGRVRLEQTIIDVDVGHLQHVEAAAVIVGRVVRPKRGVQHVQPAVGVVLGMGHAGTAPEALRRLVVLEDDVL